MFKYQFMIGLKSIGKPFPAESIENAVEIMLKRNFKGYKTNVRYVLDNAYITIVIPGRQYMTYIIYQTGLEV